MSKAPQIRRSMSAALAVASRLGVAADQVASTTNHKLGPAVRLKIARKLAAERFGRALSAARADKGLTQHQVEDVTGISRPAIARYEAGTTCPSLADALVLAQRLDFSLDDLG